jgi:spoIIIJ-associated protein
LTGDASAPAETTVEGTGETLGEAKLHALRELERLAPGLDREQVRFQVVTEGERGLLGVGYVPARVIATVHADPLRAGGTRAARDGREETPREARARAVVERVVTMLVPGVEVDAEETADELVVTCSGGELGPVIGRHGQTIDALQYLCNAILARTEDRKPVTVDAAGYRARRRRTLEEIAVRSAEQAVRGERVLLEPMTPVERKVVHEQLKDMPGVETSSEGTEPNRYVVVSPSA